MKIKYITMFFLLIFVFFSCRGPTGPQGPAGPPGPQGPQGGTGSGTNFDVIIGNMINGSIFAYPASAPFNALITLIITPNTFYALKENSLKYNSIVPINETEKQFLMPSFDVTINAEFRELEIGDIGPGGGYIFTKEIYGTGFRFREVATENITTTFTYDDAINFCDNYVINNIDDWYLPSYTELQSINSAITNGFIDRSIFPTSSYWSSTVNGTGHTVLTPSGSSPGNNTSLYRVKPIRIFTVTY